jgi:hypothetical protein
MDGSCKHGSEYLDFVKGGEFHDRPSDSQTLEDAALWVYDATCLRTEHCKCGRRTLITN